MCKANKFNKIARAVKSTIATLYENFISDRKPQTLEHNYHPHLTRKINFDEINDDASDTTKDSFASFYATSSITFCKKESPEDTFYDMERSAMAFGAPPTFAVDETAASSPSPSSKFTQKGTAYSNKATGDAA